MICSYLVQNILIAFIPGWSIDGIETQQKWLKENKLHGSYGVKVVMRMEKILDTYFDLKDKDVLVIGSVRAWIEAILLSKDVKSITTLEYAPYKTDHPKITIISPKDFAKLTKSHKAPTFDVMVTFSSLEHSGLGR